MHIFFVIILGYLNLAFMFTKIFRRHLHARIAKIDRISNDEEKMGRGTKVNEARKSIQGAEIINEEARSSH